MNVFVLQVQKKIKSSNCTSIW